MYYLCSLFLSYLLLFFLFFFFFNDTATTEIYTLSLHDALPISEVAEVAACCGAGADFGGGDVFEKRPERVEEIEIGFGAQAEACATRVFIGANEYFFCAAAAGNEADTDFYQADVGFRGGVNFRGVQADFARAARGPA